MTQQSSNQNYECFHCGENCHSHLVVSKGRYFCCEGCESVFQILNEGGLSDYYTLNTRPGKKRTPLRKEKFAFLDDLTISQSLKSYSDDKQSHVTFCLPQIHCSSCLWLLENLRRLHDGVLSCRVDFGRREADIIYDNARITLRQVVELLCRIGYEPTINLNDLQRSKSVTDNSKIFKLGVAGFCFANIMLLSFPEYLGIEESDQQLRIMFRYLAFLISIPVVFYSASEFYISAWKAGRHRFLNIDAPVALAIAITFARSVYEVFSATGSGYFDSVSGIVFFMLIGRVLQDKSFEHLNFDRSYTSYFPIASTRLNNDREDIVTLPDIEVNDTLIIHNQELIPADGILTSGLAIVDYSFVTGESHPVIKETGEILHAGGTHTGSRIEILVTKKVNQSYLTSLWNREEFSNPTSSTNHSFVHSTSRYFSAVVLSIALSAALYWSATDPTKVLNTVTAVMIVACPCALLLSSNLANGCVLKLLSRNKCYLRNAEVIEKIGNANHIVFDKTGTLTTGEYSEIEYSGDTLDASCKEKIASLAAHSTHPLSKALLILLGNRPALPVTDFLEIPGRGLQAIIDQEQVAIGSAEFLKQQNQPAEDTAVFVSIQRTVYGKFIFRNKYRQNIASLISSLMRRYTLSVLSGDNEGEKTVLRNMMGEHTEILFHQSPDNKLESIKRLQQTGKKVIMLGDGLNDAGALKQANTGIAVCNNSSHFVPASDAIIEAQSLPLFHKIIRICKTNKIVVNLSFAVSILYNLVGLYFAVQGKLSPVIAAILMPASSLTIVLINFGAIYLTGWKLGLNQLQVQANDSLHANNKRLKK